MSHFAQSLSPLRTKSKLRILHLILQFLFILSNVECIVYTPYMEGQKDFKTFMKTSEIS